MDRRRKRKTKKIKILEEDIETEKQQLKELLNLIDVLEKQIEELHDEEDSSTKEAKDSEMEIQKYREELNKIYQRQEEINEEFKKLPIFSFKIISNFKKERRLNKEESNLNKQASELEKIIAKKEIEKDRKEKPFSYFAFEESNNPIILERNTNKTTNLLDLRSIKSDWRELSWDFLQKTGENEGFFEYNIFGFMKIIKNVNEIKDDKGINSDSDKAVYKIIGPNGKIIANNVSYNEANKIYEEKTEEYEKWVEEEFKKLNK